MMCRHDLENEIKRYPKFIKEAIQKGDYSEAFQRQIELDTMKFILESE